jgi:hypothetical protein
MDFLANYFTIGQFISNYFHLSSIKSNTHYSFKKYLIGFYYNIAIINIFYVIFYFKNLFHFVLSIGLQNGKFLLYSDLADKFYSKPRLS